MRKICLVGVQGIGKTTLIKSVENEILPWIDYFIGSAILRRLVGDDFINFDNYPEEKKQYFRGQAIKFMAEHQQLNKKHILIDGHTTLYNLTTAKIECVFTKEDCLFYTDLIYYNAPPEVVLKRRLNDNKKRRITDLDIIKDELRMEREESQNVSKEFNMRWFELTDEPLESMKKHFIELLHRICNDSNGGI